MSVQEILEKRGAKKDTYYEYNQDPYQETKEFINQVLDSYDGDGFPPSYLFDASEYRYLKNKWKKKVKEDCIGFSLAAPCPVLFYIVIDDFLNEVSQKCPDFLINNIYIKNGGVIIKLEGITDDILDEIDLLSYELFDRRLLK